MPGFRPATKQKYLPQQPATDPSWSQLSPHHAIMTLPTKEHRRGWSPAQINGMLWSYQPRRLIKPRSNDSLVCTEGKPNLVLMTYGTCKGLILNNIKKNVLVHEISDKSYNNVALNLEFPGKKVSEQGPTTQATHMWHHVWEWNPGYSGGKRALSPLRYPRSPLPWIWLLSETIKALKAYKIFTKIEYMYKTFLNSPHHFLSKWSKYRSWCRYSSSFPHFYLSRVWVVQQSWGGEHSVILLKKI